MFSDGCELRIGRRKLNLKEGDLLYPAEYEYGIVIHWFYSNKETKGWIWDVDWAYNPTSLKEINDWIEEVNLSKNKPILNLDEIPSFYDRKN